MSIATVKSESYYRPLEDGRKPWTTILTIRLENGTRRQVRVAGKYAGRRAVALAQRMWAQTPIIWGEA
jgi:hypothetical protein